MKASELLIPLILYYNLYFSLADSDFDGPLTIRLYHNLEETFCEDCWVQSTHISVQNVNTGDVNVRLLNWNATTSEKLLALGRKDKLYRVKAVVTPSNGREIEFRTFTKARKLILDHITSTVIVSLDYTGTVIAVTLQAISKPAKEEAISTAPVINPTVIIRATELGPVPDTATYIQKLEREREAKERGGNSQDHLSFFSRYWFYIVLVIMFFVLLDTRNSEAVQNNR